MDAERPTMRYDAERRNEGGWFMANPTQEALALRGKTAYSSYRSFTEPDNVFFRFSSATERRS
jgi:hypothetical protein